MTDPKPQYRSIRLFNKGRVESLDWEMLEVGNVFQIVEPDGQTDGQWYKCLDIDGDAIDGAVSVEFAKRPY